MALVDSFVIVMLLLYCNLWTYWTLYALNFCALYYQYNMISNIYACMVYGTPFVYQYSIRAIHPDSSMIKLNQYQYLTSGP